MNLKFWQWDWSWIEELEGDSSTEAQQAFIKSQVKPMQQNAPITPPTPNPDALLPDWSIIPAAHHNVRALCDLEGLTYQQKQVLTACVYVESGFNINAIHRNKGTDGKVWSTDYGICQWNDVFHGSEITPDEALHNPEKAVRLMCQYWKAGKMSQWVSYSGGYYKQYLGKV